LIDDFHQVSDLIRTRSLTNATRDNYKENQLQNQDKNEIKKNIFPFAEISATAGFDHQTKIFL